MMVVEVISGKVMLRGVEEGAVIVRKNMLIDFHYKFNLAYVHPGFSLPEED